MKVNQQIQRWAIVFESKNKTDGHRRSFLCSEQGPLIFRTKKLAIQHRDKELGFIRTRKDLREEPHGWRVPKAVKVDCYFKEL